MRHMFWGVALGAVVALVGCEQRTTNRGAADTGAPRTVNKPVIDDRAAPGVPATDRPAATDNNPGGRNTSTPPSQTNPVPNPTTPPSGTNPETGTGANTAPPSTSPGAADPNAPSSNPPNQDK